MSPMVLTKEEIAEVRSMLAEYRKHAPESAPASDEYPLHLTNKKGKTAVAESADEADALVAGGFMRPDDYRAYVAANTPAEEE